MRTNGSDHRLRRRRRASRRLMAAALAAAALLGVAAHVRAGCAVAASGYHAPLPNWGIDPEAGLDWDRSDGPHRGRLYLVYTDRPGVCSLDTHIFVVYSDDQARTWSLPVRVNERAGRASDFLPQIALDPANGQVAVSWQDARAAGGGATPRFGAVSADGGASFGANFRIDAAGASPPPD